MGLEDVGALEAGLRADLVVLDAAWAVVGVMRGGAWVRDPDRHLQPGRRPDLPHVTGWSRARCTGSREVHRAARRQGRQRRPGAAPARRAGRRAQAWGTRSSPSSSSDHGVPAEFVGGLAGSTPDRGRPRHRDHLAVGARAPVAMPEAADADAGAPSPTGCRRRTPWSCPAASPPGVPPHLPVRLARMAREAGVPVLLDRRRRAARRRPTARGAVLTPNARRAGPPASAASTDPADVAAALLARRTGAPVVLTCGARRAGRRRRRRC